MKRAGLLLSLATTMATAAVAPDRLALLAEQQQVPLAELQAAVARAQLRQEVLDTISKPWEAKPWHRYRPLFVTPDRIRDGQQFWQQHAETLARAEQTYRVPASLIVAIIGVETFYGRQMGRHPVLDTLYTLGFHYPERSDFFAKEFGGAGQRGRVATRCPQGLLCRRHGDGAVHALQLPPLRRRF